MIYSVDPDLYKSGHLRPLSPIVVLGEFAKNRPGKKFPAAVIYIQHIKKISQLVEGSHLTIVLFFATLTSW